jgi:transcriptional regulator with PAS, ATPase and Fis domain
MNDISQIIFSNSSKMNKIKAIIDEIAKTDITVLIKGESGTGKELLAQTIHSNSHRKDGPFVKVNCAAIPEGLLESEMFGFERGAFTGAHIKKPGKFELANDGTILLNDIGEMSVSTQAKLLQVLQDGMFSRLGGDGDVVVNTRVIATTKDHLEESMMEGHFRQDLFFRINVINITVPPLRERKEQISPLTQYFIDLYRKKYGRDVPTVSSELIEAFKNYSWPGNIRELENMIRRIVILGEVDVVFDSLRGKTGVDGVRIDPSANSSLNSFKEEKIFNLKEVGRKAAESAEREILQAVLQETHWNRKKAARLLRMSYKGLRYKIEKYQLNR